MSAPPRHRSPLLRFPCSTCGAKPGELCRAASGAPTYDAHAARRAAEAEFYREEDRNA